MAVWRRTGAALCLLAKRSMDGMRRWSMNGSAGDVRVPDIRAGYSRQAN
jgi:hypothetical protein